MLIKTLKAHGHTCDEAENGQIAVRMVQLKGLAAYDTILMDFVMVSPHTHLSPFIPSTTTHIDTHHFTQFLFLLTTMYYDVVNQ